eukprot:CAMPEP_0113695200 /NCGR_PEP_ID=MMETSP0038_2-20120614/20758_1 /TAXON_ID=2898 /ORGANISM="Cryptomonas paramecium" /LENGTH=124 /DNA_ID=CAMNT_0000617697 /DNA_START=396 /DNA_END=767 /DNA_ORIENTATION=- /assembly_acc=CAM_ASM_000170
MNFFRRSSSTESSAPQREVSLEVYLSLNNMNSTQTLENRVLTWMECDEVTESQPTANRDYDAPSDPPVLKAQGKTIFAAISAANFGTFFKKSSNETADADNLSQSFPDFDCEESITSKVGCFSW